MYAIYKTLHVFYIYNPICILYIQPYMYPIYKTLNVFYI